MRRRDGLTKFPERLVAFTFGLLFSKGMMTFVMGNFMTFLTDFWNLKLMKAVTIVNLREGLKDMLQIYIALFIDAFLGYRWMLVLSSVLYSAGLGLLAFSAPQYFFNNEEECPDEKVDCFNFLKHTPFWEGFVLLIVGGAAQVIPLYSLSFDQTKVVKAPEYFEPTRVKVGCWSFKVNIGSWRQLQQRFLRLLCTAFMMLGIITSGSSFIRSYNKWHQRFLISAISIVIGLLWFLCGFPLYGKFRPKPNPLSTMLRVLIAAVGKRHLNYRENLEQLHRGDRDDQNQLLTDHLECLNNAALEKSSADEGTRWKPCTVKEVEEAKLLLDVIPMTLTFIAYGMVKSLGNTLFIEQAYVMTGGILVVTLQIIQYVSKSAVNKGYKLVFEKRINREQRWYSDGMKIGLGMLASIICCTTALYVESARLKALRKKGLSNHRNAADAPAPISADATSPISAYWLVPQFFFLGAMEGLAGDGIQDFFGHYIPDSRRNGPVFTSSLIGFGTLLNIGFITVLDYYSKYRYNESWLGDSINESRLDNIYRAYIMVALVNCFLYAHVSTWYSYDNIVGRPEEEDEIPFLEVEEEEETAAGDQQDNQGQSKTELIRMPLRN